MTTQVGIIGPRSPITYYITILDYYLQMNNKTNLVIVSFVAGIFAATVMVTTPTTIKHASAIVGGAPTTTVKLHAGGGNSTTC